MAPSFMLPPFLGQLIVSRQTTTGTDYPKFSYRGLLLDTARHFLPVGEIKKVLDIMSWMKMNVLHWHIADLQSFPLEVPSYERLWDGSYSVMERYTIGDAKAIVEYARKRGIHVMAELDLPGHAESWGFGYPMLWPSPQCREPLDVSKKFTFDLNDELSKVFTFDFMHLGGDEVDTSCWMDTPQVNEWLHIYLLLSLLGLQVGLCHSSLCFTNIETMPQRGRERACEDDVRIRHLQSHGCGGGYSLSHAQSPHLHPCQGAPHASQIRPFSISLLQLHQAQRLHQGLHLLHYPRFWLRSATLQGLA